MKWRTAGTCSISVTVAAACGPQVEPEGLLAEAQAPLVLSEAAKLTALDGEAGDSLGGTVGISGSYAIVGAWGDDDAGTDGGAAYLFSRDGSGAWGEGAKLTGADTAAGDYFGTAVSISDSYAIVGAAWDDDNGDQSGSAYVFERAGTGEWNEHAKLTASDGAAGERFGSSVSLSGDYVIVGAWLDDDNGDQSGSAYVFERAGTGEWNEHAKLTASDGTAGSFLGYAVGVSGEHALIGAFLADAPADQSGAAYVFERAGSGQWLEQAKLTASDGDEGDCFGSAVSVSGDHAIVSAPYDEEGGSVDGAAYAFERDVTGSWVEQQKMVAADGADGDAFGYAVGLSGEYAIIGAPYDADLGADSGSAYVYENPCAGQPDGTACDDGIFCNGADSCQDEDCTIHAGDPCAASVGDDDADCLESCDEATDECSAADPDGSACDDGLFCNGTESCTAGVCGGSTGNPCPGADGDEDCRESCDEVWAACTASDPDGSACAGGALCRGGECPGTHGSACTEASQCEAPYCTDGVCCLSADCSPYRCGADGSCLAVCASAADCQPGHECSDDGRCVVESGSEDEEEGSCGCATPGRRPTPPTLSWVALALLLVRRRRRARPSARR